MGIASSIINRADKLATDRAWWLSTWQDIARLVIPTEAAALSFSLMNTGNFRPAVGSSLPGPNSQDRVKKIYDNTGMVALDRLSAGMESLVTPQSEKWHGLTVSDIDHGEQGVLSDDETTYLERLRNFQFSLRYDPRGGFIPTHQKAMRSCIAFGTGILYTEEGDGNPSPGDVEVPLRYSYVPLSEALLSANKNGMVDTNYRVRSYTVRQLVQKFGYNKVSAQVQAMYDKGTDLERHVDVIHAVCPREEMGSYLLKGTIRGSKIASYYIERDTKWLLSDGGYFEFPFSIYHWLQQDNGPYGESPVMLALSEIKSLQLMGKGELRAFAQWTDPPLGMPSDGVMNRPNLNPRAINYGAVGADGSLRVKPILTSQNPDFAEKVMDVRRGMVKETMYVNLFQILIQNPEMTATEAMLRANEKGELLGPAGGKIQMALAQQIDRELAILSRKGIFRPTSSFAAPQSLAGKSISVRFSSPLDRMRRASEGTGIVRLLDAIVPLAKVKPTVMDNIDEDRVVRQLREILGAPADVIVRESVLKQRRQVTSDKMNQAQQLAAGQGMADIAKAGSIAGRNMGETATQSPQIMQALSEILDRLRGGVQAAPNAAPQAVDTTNALMAQFGKPPVEAPSGLPPGG